MDNETDVTHNAFAGFARVELSQLVYEGQKLCEYVNKQPSSVRKRVNKLVKVFEHEGCIREERHAIHIIISQDELEDQQFPKELPVKVAQLPRLQSKAACIHGIHRALAGCEHLAPNDQWWIARVFTEFLPIKEKERISRDYNNEQPRADGMIFFEILTQRQLGGHESKVRERIQWARLSESKRKDLRQLLDRTDLFHSQTSYFELFSNLTKWIGLWPAVRLGTLHRLLPMKCDHELVNYLRYIHETWNAIVAGVDDYEPNVVDEKTVACLETMVPGTSKADGDKITGAMTGKSIFRNITSDEHRNRILQNIHQLPGMIPSLFTFFESLKYLEPCAKIMRVLCDPKPKVCVKEALQRVYHRPERLTVEYAENDFREHTTALESTFAIGYQQLWLFALRNFPQMSSATTLMESDQGRPKATAQNPLLWKAFGQLAARVGFRSEQIDRLVAANAVEELAKQLASSFGAQVDVRFVEEIASVLRTKTIVHEDAAELSLASVRTLPLNFRCGLPFTNHHQLDRAHLFLPKLQPGPIEQIENVSTFYFKREMFNHFLGDRLIDEEFSAHAADEEVAYRSSVVGSDACHTCDCQENQIVGLQGKISEHASHVKELSANANYKNEVEGLQSKIDEQSLLIEELSAKADEMVDAEFEAQVYRSEPGRLREVEDHLRVQTEKLQMSEKKVEALEAQADLTQRLRRDAIDLEQRHTELQRRFDALREQHDGLSDEYKAVQVREKEAETAHSKLGHQLELLKQKNQTISLESEEEGVLVLKVVVLNIEGTECSHGLKIRGFDPMLKKIVQELCHAHYRGHTFRLQKPGDLPKVVAYREVLTPQSLLKQWKSGGPTLIVEIEIYYTEVGPGGKKRKAELEVGIENWLELMRVEAEKLAKVTYTHGEIIREVIDSDSGPRRKLTEQRKGRTHIQGRKQLEGRPKLAIGQRGITRTVAEPVRDTVIATGRPSIHKPSDKSFNDVGTRKNSTDDAEMGGTSALDSDSVYSQPE